MLGIIGAMDVEVKKLREMMEDPEIQTVAGMTFYQEPLKERLWSWSAPGSAR